MQDKMHCIHKEAQAVKGYEIVWKNLPWVDNFKHLGNNISNQFSFTNQDIRIKRAVCANKNIKIYQEFYFAISDKIHTILGPHFGICSMTKQSSSKALITNP